MIFNDHSKLQGLHAFLGASNYRWTGWTPETLEKRFYGQYAQQIGTVIHELARDLIFNRIKLEPGDTKLIDLTLARERIPSKAYNSNAIIANLIPFVNDSIGYRMSPEVILFHSYNSFGTADAISFNEREKTLRINDLKTGVTKTKMEQLYIYAALFCIEYKYKPHNINFELRIYQSNEVLEDYPAPEVIEAYLNMILDADRQVQQLLERNLK